MRMWNIPPQYLCRRHLLGEHLESHMFVGTINEGKRIKGYLNGLLIVSNLKNRHQELVDEMDARGYNHKSPLPDFNYDGDENGQVDMWENVGELMNRCPDCKGRLLNFVNKGTTND